MADKGEAVRAGVCPVCGCEEFDYDNEDVYGEGVAYHVKCRECEWAGIEDYTLVFSTLVFSAFFGHDGRGVVATPEDEIGSERVLAASKVEA